MSSKREKSRSIYGLRYNLLQQEKQIIPLKKHNSPEIEEEQARTMKKRKKLTWSSRFVLTGSLSIALLVITGCKLRPAFAADGNAPRIIVHPSDVIVIEGDASELSCEVDGDPEPKIEWFQDGELVEPSNTRTTLGGSIQFLEVRATVQLDGHSSAARKGDSGVYWCQASNSLGVARSKNASLQVACKYNIESSLRASRLKIDFTR